jgi:hypothetical protein
LRPELITSETAIVNSRFTANQNACRCCLPAHSRRRPAENVIARKSILLQVEVTRWLNIQ